MSLQHSEDLEYTSHGPEPTGPNVKVGLSSLWKTATSSRQAHTPAERPQKHDWATGASWLTPLSFDHNSEQITGWLVRVLATRAERDLLHQAQGTLCRQGDVEVHGVRRVRCPDGRARAPRLRGEVEVAPVSVLGTPPRTCLEV